MSWLRSSSAALLIGAVMTGRTALAGPTPLQPPGRLDDPRSWAVLASGDEILALAIDPHDPQSLWAGTEGGGAIVWDRSTGGFVQHAFPTQPGLPSNRIHDIAFGRVAGEAWLGTEGGVARASRATWTAWTTADGLPDDDVRAIAVAPSGTVWAGTRDAGVASWDPRTGAWAAWPTVPFDPLASGPFEGPGSATVSAIAVGADGRVWVAHGRQADASRPALSVFEPRSGGWSHIGAVGPTGNPLRGPVTDQILALAVDGSGALWAGTWARGVLRFDGATWRSFDANHGLCGRTVPALTADGSGVWATCADDRAGRGAARWDGAKWTAWPSAGDGQLLLAIAATGGSAYLGANGPGAGGTGVLTLADDGTTGTRYTTAPLTPASNDFTALLFATDGTLWAGTRGAGLLRFDGERWDQFTLASTRGALAGDVVTDLAEREGEVWVASTKTLYRDGVWIDGGVSRIDLATRAWRSPLRAASGDLPDDDVSSLAVGADGRVWLGFGAAAGGSGAAGTTHNGNGVAIHNPETHSFEFYTYAGTRRGLVGDTVLDLAVVGDVGWVAASHQNDLVIQRRAGGGVSRLVDEAWTGWTGGKLGLISFHGSGKPTDRDPLITGDVRSIHVARDGVVWAGSYDLLDGSLLDAWPRVDAAINRFDGTRWQADVIRGSGWVAAIEDDAAGRIWIGVTRGHGVAEPDPFGIGVRDVVPGAYVRQDAAWEPLAIGTSLIGAHGVTAIAEDPATGAVWLATENAGLFAYGLPALDPTATATGGTRTATREPTPTRRAPTPTATRATASPSPRRRVYLPVARTGQIAAPATPATPAP